MLLPDKKDALHKAWLLRTLEAVADDVFLSQTLYFKGGTCASLLGWLPRFSVDLDFDYAGDEKDKASIEKTRRSLEKVFVTVGLSIKDRSKRGIQYFLKYPPPHFGARNTLKIDVSFPIFKSSKYEPLRFTEIDRMLICQTRDTMFAHKLVTPLDRFEKTGQIAGRDFFDIRHFFLSGYAYCPSVIQERRGVSVLQFLRELSAFTEKQLTEKIIGEDLSALLPLAEFTRVRKVLKREVLNILQDEIQRVKNNHQYVF